MRKSPSRNKDKRNKKKEGKKWDRVIPQNDLFYAIFDDLHRVVLNN